MANGNIQFFVKESVFKQVLVNLIPHTDGSMKFCYNHVGVLGRGDMGGARGLDKLIFSYRHHYQESKCL